MTKFLEPIGSIEGFCYRLLFTSPIDAIDVSYNKKVEAIDGIRYIQVDPKRPRQERTNGVLGDDQTQFEFNELNIAVGIHGRVDKGVIKQIGFITTYDAEQAFLDEETDSSSCVAKTSE